MSFFAPMSAPAPLSMSSGSSGTYQQPSNMPIFIIILVFFVMLGGALFYYLSRLSQEDIGKKWLEENENIEIAKINAGQ